MLAAPSRRVLVPLVIDAHPPAFGDAVHALDGRSMGTTWSVRLVSKAGRDISAIAQGIQRELDLVVAQMSTWEADSDLCRFNQAPAGSWHVLPEPFFQVLHYALSVAADSQGAYDPTAGALVNAWGFGPKARFDAPDFRPPSAEEIGAACDRVGWQRVLVDGADNSAFQPGNVYVDLSAVAKGYAVDRVSHYLQTQGIASALVEIGGELRGSGIKPDGQPWWVSLQRPAARTPGVVSPAIMDTTETVVALHGLSVATSGDYLRYFEHDGLRHPHTIDPRSGWPIAHGLASVTVIHASCMAADALSTALTVMGMEQGMAWAEQRGIAALFVARTGLHADPAHEQRDAFTEYMSTAFLELAQ